MKGENKIMIYLLFFLYIILSSSGLVLFKLGTANTNILFSILGINISLKMIIGGMFYIFSFVLWLYIVSKMNLTIAMPISVALVNTLVVVESCLILKEKISLVQGIGILIIITGVILVVGGQK